MNYLSTRDKSLNFNFKDIFLRGLAPDGGLFLPSEIRYYNKSELENLSKLSYSCLLYTSPSPRDRQKSRMPSSA